MIKYTKGGVKALRDKRKIAKSNNTSPYIKSDSEYQSFLGELKGAGHLEINGFQKLDIKTHSPIVGTSYKEIDLKFIIPTPTNSSGERPHFIGYIQSAADVDSKRYKVKGWLNENGIIRFEVVK